MTIDELVSEAQKIVGEFTLSEKYLSAGSAGAALITKSGRLYTGICIDLACGIGFCAEHAAIAEMLKNRETQIEMIVAVSKDKILAPCGRCREMMLQINKENMNTKVILPEKRTILLKELLPESWI